MRFLPSDTRTTGLAGALAGLAGSLCCLGPSAAVLLGLGSSSALWGLALDQRLALGAGAALLLAGLALALRAAQACAFGRARWRAPLAVLAAFALSYGALGLLLPRVAGQAQVATPMLLVAAPAPAAAEGPELRRVTLIVEKMTCPPCAGKVQRLLARQPAVRGFVAIEGNEEVQIDYDARLADAEALLRLIPSSLRVSLLRDESI